MNHYQRERMAQVKDYAKFVIIITLLCVIGAIFLPLPYSVWAGGGTISGIAGIIDAYEEYKKVKK